VTHPAAVFEYDLRELPPGRVPFRRWRFELWQRGLLVRSGWRVTPRDAERALRIAASRRVHDLIGVQPLLPENTRARPDFTPGATMMLECGAVICVLEPRRGDDDEREEAA
jgi:hypothetical protein